MIIDNIEMIIALITIIPQISIARLSNECQKTTFEIGIGTSVSIGIHENHLNVCPNLTEYDLRAAAYRLRWHSLGPNSKINISDPLIVSVNTELLMQYTKDS